MRPDIVNRIVFVLVCAGAAVALITGIFHAFETSLPCGSVPEGGVSGCDQVAQDSWAWMLGIPIAFYGAALYAGIALLAILRERSGSAGTLGLGRMMWAGLFLGSVTSVVLLVHSTFDIRATCPWCWASGSVMVASFLLQTVGLARSSLPDGRRWPVVAFAVFGVIVWGGAAAWAYSTAKAGKDKAIQKEEVQPSPDVELVRADSPSLGPADAPITIVEFSDLHCPSCSKNHFELKKLMATRLKDQVRLVYRHYPLIGRHPDSGLAAVFAEWAGEQDKFWNFVDIMMGNQDKSTPEQMLALVSQLGLDVNQANGLISNSAMRRPYVERVDRDRQDAFKLGVDSTPTWFVKYPDGSIMRAVGDGIQNLLAEGELAKRGYQPR